MSASVEDCSLSNVILNALLVRVAPGREKDTLEEIDRKFGSDTNVYLGFGRYDLIILREEEDFSLLKKFNNFGLSHVTEWFPLVGLKWVVRHAKNSGLSQLGGVLGFCFLKLDPENSMNKDNPIDDELGLIKNIRTTIPCHIYSSLGFNELVIVIHAKTFRELARRIVSLRECLEDESTPRTLDITTIPAINYRSVVAGIEPVLTDKIKGYLLVSLRTNLSDGLRKKLEEIAGGTRVSSIYGFHDTLIELSGNPSNVIKTIMRIREEGLSCGLFSTFTLLSLCEGSLELSLTSHRIQESSQLSRENESNDQGRVIDQISYYRNCFRAIRRDPMTRYLFRDLSRFFSELEKRGERVNMLKKEDVSAYMAENLELDSVLECLRVGFEQRCSRLNPGNLLGQGTVSTEPLGNIQRAILALEAVPIYIFKTLDLGSWSGFCIYGFSSRFYRSGGIINVPHQYRIRPEMWWGIFHEIGHEAIRNLDDETKARLMMEIQIIVDGLLAKTEEARALERKYEVEEEGLKQEIYEIVEEIFAELFGYHFGFNDDWQLYSRRFWSYMTEEFELDSEHLARSILAYFTLGPGRKLTRAEITAEEIDKLLMGMSKLGEISANAAISKTKLDEVREHVWLFLDVADVIGSYLESKQRLFSLERSKEISISLEKGKIVKHHNPFEILFSIVNSEHEKSCRHRFAVILSLYNAYLKMLKKDFS